MGRLVLLIVALLAMSLPSTGCAPAGSQESSTEGPGQESMPGSPGQESTPGRPEHESTPESRDAPAGDASAGGLQDDAHGGLACVQCHRGGSTAREMAAVPARSCTASGCHSDGGPAQVDIATVTFVHRNHGAEDALDMDCAGCHTHADGNEPLSAGTGACGLCHAERMDGDEPGDCRTCHALPSHLGVTSQGVPIPHDGMPWVQGECVRCHYDVSEPPLHVSSSTCAACHTDIQGLTARSIAEDLHPDHTEVSCASCHGEDTHRIVAMSSAVTLQCGDCHVVSHGVDLAESADVPFTNTCSACHREVHADQQRLVLGAFPGREDARPSEKFLAGLTCRSCHVGTQTGPGETFLTGSAVSCQGCHEPAYRTVLQWWTRGTEQRVAQVDAYLDRSRTMLGASPTDTVRSLLAQADERLASVRAGQGQHNLPFSHRLLQESLQHAGDAVRLAGRSAPAPPDLGREPSMGLCSYCHYRTDDQLRFGEMDEAFHRRVLGVTDVRR